MRTPLNAEAPTLFSMEIWRRSDAKKKGNRNTEAQKHKTTEERSCKELDEQRIENTDIQKN